MYHLSEGKSVPIRSWTLDIVRDIYSIFPGRLSVTLSVTECYSTRRHFAETSVHTEYIKTKSRPDSTRILIWDFSSFHFSVNTVPTSMFIGFLSLNHMETFLLPCMSDLFNFYFKISNFIICLAICWILQHNQNKKGTNLYHVHNHLVFYSKRKKLVQYVEWRANRKLSIDKDMATFLFHQPYSYMIYISGWNSTKVQQYPPRFRDKKETTVLLR